MRNKLYFLGSIAVAMLLAAGCAGPERKLGRGIANTGEIIRAGEMQRSVEHGGIFDGPDVGITTGFVQGINKTLARTGVGIYEVVTFPIPSYDPIFTNYLSPKPGYPDAYRPRKWAEPVFDTDHSLGFSGGDVFPWLPGSRFTVFDN